MLHLLQLFGRMLQLRSRNFLRSNKLCPHSPSNKSRALAQTSQTKPHCAPAHHTAPFPQNCNTSEQEEQINAEALLKDEASHCRLSSLKVNNIYHIIFTKQQCKENSYIFDESYIFFVYHKTLILLNKTNLLQSKTKDKVTQLFMFHKSRYYGPESARDLEKHADVLNDKNLMHS